MAAESMMPPAHRSQGSSSSSRLSVSLSMTPQDADRMAEASHELQQCLMSVPIPKDTATASKQNTAAFASKKESSTTNSTTTGENDNPVTTSSYLDSNEALHNLLDRRGGTVALHGMLVEAAKQCKHSAVESFLPRMVASGVPEPEAKVGFVIFHEMDKSSKLKLVFEVLAASLAENTADVNAEGEQVTGQEKEKESQQQQQQQQDHHHDHKENAGPNNEAPVTTAYSTPNKSSNDPSTITLDQDGAHSLFRTILMSIACCVNYKGDDETALKPVVTEDEEISLKESFEPPHDMTKSKDAKKPQTSPSSSAGHGLPEQLRKEVECESSKAARDLIDFALSRAESKGKPSVASKDAESGLEVSISFDIFGAWYNSGGCAVAPWVELLRLSKWKRSSSSAIVPSASTVSSSTAGTSMSQKKAAPSRKSDAKSRPYGASLSSMLKEDEEAMRRMTTGPPGSSHYNQQQSRTVVTFDFSSASEGGVATTTQPLCLSISEESLWVLRALVYRSGLIYRSAAEVCKTIMKMSHKRMWDGRPLVTLRRDDFRHLIRTLITPPGPSSATKTQNRLSSSDIEDFSKILEDFFACFEGNFHQSCTPYHPLSHDEVNAKELAVGFCFLCAGNKSTKLATSFELLDDTRSGFLTQQQLMRFLRSYLTIMVGTSLLRENHARKRQPLSHDQKEELRAAVENGAHWTLRHFLKTARTKHTESYERDAFSFEVFANWYSKGGYTVAPWLELLDLNKLFSLLGESESFAAMPRSQKRVTHPNTSASIRECRSSHRRQHHNRSSTPTAQVLFTFPLANQRSLIVLRDDAIYVRGVVEQLGALSLSSADIWSTLMSEVKKRPGLRGPNSTKPRKKSADPDKNTLLDLKTFLDMMEVVLQSASGLSRKRAAEGTSKLSPSVRELLSNFFHSYDLKQASVVSMNELMGGLSLLCGGKKSTKLAFAFGVFDGRVPPKSRKGKNKQNLKNQSLDVGDLFLFLRSFLIVLFSCCCQTLDMSDSSVDRYITDTANMVAEDVMRYQWHTRKVERIDFDEFGEWYNEGGFEIAPWLELLDLKKWVLVDDFDALDTQAPASSATAATLMPAAREEAKQSPTCPPPPPEDVLDPSFFESDADDIMQMDSIDEMDIMLMPSHDKEGDLLPVSKFTYSPRPEHLRVADQAAGDDGQCQALKFHLMSEEEHGGFLLSISQKRIRHFRQVMVDAGLHEVSTETACMKILNSVSLGKLNVPQTITREEFESAVRDILGIKDQGAGAEDHKCLFDVLSYIFSAFDMNETGQPDALEVACGFTVLCRGKKSDKLEYAFEVLDKDKKGELSNDDMFNYMRSFLTVLLGVACCPALDTDELEDTLTTMNGNEVCERSLSSVIRAVNAGSKWAVAQAFRNRDDFHSISFDDFAAWYTEEGHISIPWIELLALRKWLI